MTQERIGTSAEQISWDQQLSTAVDERVQFLRIWYATEKNGGPRYGLKAPDGTQIGLAVFPTTAEQQSSYLPDAWIREDMGRRRNTNAPNMVRGAFECGTHDIAFYHSLHQEAAIPGMDHDEYPRLAFVIETHATRSVHVASPQGGLTAITPADARYEAFVEPDGTLLDVYKLGEDQQLHPVEPTEGERLLWQVSHSVPSPNEG